MEIVGDSTLSAIHERGIEQGLKHQSKDSEISRRILN